MGKSLFVLAMFVLGAGLLFSTVTVTSPNGGESWTPGYSYDVTWTVSGMTGLVKIELYQFTGILSLVDTINPSIGAGAGTYSWRIPLTTPAAANYVVKITSLTSSTETDVSNNMFTITEAPTLTVTAPNGGENWTIGTTHNVTWTSSNLTGNLGIMLLIGTSGNYSTVGFVQTPTVGSYNWTIPNTLTPGTQMKIRVYSVLTPAIADTSDNFFTISQAPGVYVTSPNGGETWYKGSSYPIQWNAVNITGSAKIELFKGTSTTPTATIVSSTVVTNGIQMWNIPTTISNDDDYKIKITSLSNAAVYDYSNDFFTITTNTETDDQNQTPSATGLQSVYPNPFRDTAAVKYYLKNAGKAQIRIYDIRGRLVRALHDEVLPQGEHTAEWNGIDDSGKAVSNGIYYLYLQTAAGQSCKKLVLVR